MTRLRKFLNELYQHSSITNIEKRYFAHLSKVHINDTNDDAIKNALRKVLKLRWSYIRNSKISYEKYHSYNVNCSNRAWAEIARMVAGPNESIAQVLMPTLRIQYYAEHDDWTSTESGTLRTLTEKIDATGERYLDLSKFIVSYDGKSVIFIREWFDDQLTRLTSTQFEPRPNLKYLYRLAVNGSDRLLTEREFVQKYPGTIYSSTYEAPSLSHEDIAKISACAGKESKKYITLAMEYQLINEKSSLFMMPLKHWLKPWVIMGLMDQEKIRVLN